MTRKSTAAANQLMIVASLSTNSAMPSVSGRCSNVARVQLRPVVTEVNRAEPAVPMGSHRDPLAIVIATAEFASKSASQAPPVRVLSQCH